ncbi:MAG: hypothetical protein JWM05_1957, partial [Acidimicrobiales bacterium]|nr:hypothetical protein [Acidimicrobiales bacterium]
MSTTGPTLAVPEGWVLDGSTRERMARQLAAAPAHVAGIVASTGPLPPGTSYRIHAERLSLRPLTDVSEAGSSTVAGAVLARADVGCTVGPGEVSVERGTLLVDHGTHAHDPDRALGEPGPASADDRPPFPWRPVVVLFGLDAGGTGDGDWARRLVNDLLDEGIESRLAVPAVAPGRHLTQPCQADIASLVALGPDVVVALDATALAAVQAERSLPRGTTAVALATDAGGVELVSWQVGRAAGRLRARVSPDV